VNWAIAAAHLVVANVANRVPTSIDPISFSEIGESPSGRRKSTDKIQAACQKLMYDGASTATILEGKQGDKTE
jgi:hypothetical protein